MSLYSEFKVLTERVSCLGIMPKSWLGQGIIVYSLPRLPTVRQTEASRYYEERMEQDDQKLSLPCVRLLSQRVQQKETCSRDRRLDSIPRCATNLLNKSNSEVDLFFFNKHLLGSHNVPGTGLRTWQILTHQ